jgi:tetratricopeptide (TPR) repeat protein
VDRGLGRIRAWLETETDDALRGELAVATVRALRAEGRFEDALGFATRHAEEGGFELAMERAGVLRELGRGQEAARTLADARAPAAEDEIWRLETRADALLEAGDLDGAAEGFAALGRLPGGGSASRFGAARVARERGAFDEALALLADVDDPRAPMERAQVLEGLGRYDEAETAWSRIALSEELERRSAGVLGLARVKLARDDASGALAALAPLTVVDPGYRLTYAQVRAEALLGLGRASEARAVYAALGGDAESRIVGLLGQGECALALDDAAGAVTFFQRALDAATDRWYRATALAALARAHAEQGDAGAARSILARLRREHPDREDAIAAAAAAAGVAP